MSDRKDILVVAGARPNFMKIAPILRAMSHSKTLRGRLIHTGQHHDENMSGSFFRDLGIQEPERNLQINGGTQSAQTAEIMKAFEPVMLEIKPAAILVVGDVTSTLACSLVAAKNRVQVVHVEAGLRSFDREMPEEINRVLTDQISDILFTTERDGDENLKREGIAPEKIHFVGNVMVDSVEHHAKQAPAAAETLASLGLNIGGPYILLTLHRPSNVDHKDQLQGLIKAVGEISKMTPVIFPAHPRTMASIRKFGLEGLLNDIHVVEPLSYISMLSLMKSAAIVMTDSGGLQEETTALGVQCFTLRENTERWITVKEGTNTVIGTNPDALLAAYKGFQQGAVKTGSRPELWDGHAAERIVAILEKAFA